MFKKCTALFVCCCIAVTCLFFQASAAQGSSDYGISKEDWDAAWPALGEVNTNVCLSPGSDETMLGFTWHAPAGSGVPFVRLSKDAGMAAAVEFTGQSAPADGGFVSCRVTASGLEPGTTYYYTYGTDAAVFGPFRFTSAAADKVKFLFVNDMHQGYDAANAASARDTSYKIHSRFAGALALHPDARLILSGGDQVRSGYLAGEWNALLASPVFRSVPVAFAVGNHDKSGDMMRYYVNNPNEYDAALPSETGRDFWFRQGDALFLVFDSTNGNASEHVAFAREAVNANLDAKWRIGLLHHDLYTPAYPILLPVQAVFSPIVDRAGLDVLLRGHSHIFGRSHFMLNGRIAGYARGSTVTDPKGTMYLSMNAFQNNTVSDIRFQNGWTAKRNYDTAVVYSTFDLEGDTMVYRGYSPAGELKDEYTIVKTGMPAPFREPRVTSLYRVVELVGLIYAMFDFAIK